MLTKEPLEILYEKYMSIVELEVNEFGCKPTDVRHLPGRLGGFFQGVYYTLGVKKVTEMLAYEANQQGFDVIAENGSRISVKKTALSVLI